MSGIQVEGVWNLKGLLEESVKVVTLRLGKLNNRNMRLSHPRFVVWIGSFLYKRVTRFYS